MDLADSTTAGNTITHVPPRIARDDAIARATSRRLFGRLRAPKFPNLPSAELIWFPYFLVEIEAINKNVPKSVMTSVEGWTGAFALFDMDADLVTGVIEGPRFPPKLDEDASAKIARTQLQIAILRQRGAEKPVVNAVLSVERLLYPLWVYYHERRRGLIDIKIIDAVTGAKGGAQTRKGVLEAFKARGADKRQQP